AEAACSVIDIGRRSRLIAPAPLPKSVERKQKRTKSIKRTQKRRRRVVDEGWWNLRVWHAKEDVVGSAKPLGGRVQIFRVKALPASCIQTLNQRQQSSYRFCCCEGAVPPMMHKRLAQERAMGRAGEDRKSVV